MGQGSAAFAAAIKANELGKIMYDKIKNQKELIITNRERD